MDNNAKNMHTNYNTLWPQKEERLITTCWKGNHQWSKWGKQRAVFRNCVKRSKKIIWKASPKAKRLFLEQQQGNNFNYISLWCLTKEKSKGNDISVGCVWAVWVMTNEGTLRGIQVTFFGWLPFLCPPRGVISHCWEAPAHIFQTEEGSGWQNEWQHLISHVCTRWWALGLENLHGL